MAAFASLACSWASGCPYGDSALVLHNLMKEQSLGVRDGVGTRSAMSV